MFNKFKLIELGSFGEVVRAMHLLTNEQRAIKIIDKDKLQEHKILMQLQQSEFQVLQETVCSTNLNIILNPLGPSLSDESV
jgi:hypothetical protein